MNKVMYWQNKPCLVTARAPYKKRIKRNCLIELLDGTGITVVVPCRALRVKGKEAEHAKAQTNKEAEHKPGAGP